MEFLFVGDVMQMLGLSKSASYKIIKQLNTELKERGFMTVAGRVHRGYFLKRFYYEDGLNHQPAHTGGAVADNKKKTAKRRNEH